MYVADPDLIAFGYKVAISAAVGTIMGIVLWPFRRARKEWAALKTEQASIHAELVKQRENCLQTLQTQGATMIELQSKTVGILEGVRLDLAEQTGYLKAAMSQPPTRRRAIAKTKK